MDLDDTLSDHHRAMTAAVAAIAHEAGLQQPLERLIEEYARILELWHPREVAGNATRHQARSARIQGLYALDGRTADATAVQRAIAAGKAAYEANRFPVAGAPELLLRLRHLAPVVVVSNHVRGEQEEKLAYLQLAYDHLVVSAEVGAMKPDPAVFRTALAWVGAAPCEAVMIGDSWANDIVGACGLGLPAVWLNRQGRLRPDSHPVLELRSFEPVPETVARIVQFQALPAATLRPS